MFVLLCRPDPAETPGDTPAMRVHRKNLSSQRIHQNASRRFLPHPWQRQQKRFGLLVTHPTQCLERWRAKPRHDHIEKIADRPGLLVRQAAAGDRPRDIFGGRFGNVQVGWKGFFQSTEGAPVARFGSLRAAHDEQQLVQRVF